MQSSGARNEQRFPASCIQFTSARDYEPNIRVVSDLFAGRVTAAPILS
jgi:hypothetical protein